MNYSLLEGLLTFCIQLVYNLQLFSFAVKNCLMRMVFREEVRREGEVETTQ